MLGGFPHPALVVVVKFRIDHHEADIGIKCGHVGELLADATIDKRGVLGTDPAEPFIKRIKSQPLFNAGITQIKGQ